MFEKAKNHFKEHRELYFGIGIGLGLATVTGLIMKNYSDRCLAVVPKELPSSTMGEPRTLLDSVGGDITGSFLSAVSENGNATIVNTIHTGGRGHPGFITRHLETGALFETQGAAARAFDIPEMVLSKHLNGEYPHAHNQHFERLGVLS